MQVEVGRATIAQMIPVVEQFTHQVEEQLGDLSPRQLNWKPNPEVWSLGQCIDHLIVANSTYVAPLEGLLAGTKTTTFWERLPFAPALFGRMLIASLDPERQQKMPTIKVFAPTSSTVDETILPAFVRQQARLVELMQACAALDAERIIITSPAARFVTYSLLDAFRIIVVHEQHHFVQTAKLLAMADFPAS